MATKGVLTRQNIVDKSLHLFSVKGYYNTSVNDILDATGLTKGGLYGHFKGKKEIWHAAYAQAVIIWKEIVFKGIEKTDNPLHRIEKALDNDLRHYLGGNVFEGGCFFLNMLVELSGQSRQMSQFVLDGIMGFSGLMAKWLKEAEGKKIIRPGLDHDEMAAFLVTTINGCAALYAATRHAGTWKLTLSQIHQYLDAIKRK